MKALVLFHFSVILVLWSSAAGGHVGGHVDNELLRQVLARMETLEERNRVLEDTVTYQQTQIEALQQELTSQREDAGKEATGSNIERRFIMDVTEGPVAFTSRIDAILVDHMKTNQTIRFGHELLDLGGGYNNQTGVFTAPLSGIYMFSCSLLDHQARADGSGTMVHGEIMQEGTTLARVFAHADGSLYRDQGAQTIVVEVQKGDRVYVRVIDHANLQLGGDLYSTFSGYMLWQM